MARRVLLQLSGPATHKVTLDALERVFGVAKAPLFVLLRNIGVARWTLAGQLALILDVVVLDEVFVDVVDHVEFGVADGAYEQLLIVARVEAVVGRFGDARRRRRVRQCVRARLLLVQVVARR